MAKKGYITKKALEWIAAERRGEKPKLPRSRAMRGRIKQEKMKYEEKRRPKDPELQKVYERTLEKLGYGLDRPFLYDDRNGEYHSGRKGSTVQEMLFQYADYLSSLEKRTPYKRWETYTLEEIQETDSDITEIAGRLGDAPAWRYNMALKKYQIHVWTERYLQ